MRYLLTYAQWLLPHHGLSRGMYWLTRRRWPLFKNLFIRLFIRLYGVDMSLAVQPQATAYASFNDFFTRQLHQQARPIVSEAGALACPVDGTVSQAGAIVQEQIFQAKGHAYNLTTLLGGHPALASQFSNGQFATLYLSPRDYHRIHMPLAGRLTDTIYVPGRLFSVNRRTTSTLPGLFARNERLVTVFDTEIGPLALVLVGALFVSGIETVWEGLIKRPYPAPRHRRYTDADAIQLDKGQEMGRFNMGSTVIVLIGAKQATLAPDIHADAPVQMGQLLGNIKQTRD